MLAVWIWITNVNYFIRLLEQLDTKSKCRSILLARLS